MMMPIVVGHQVLISIIGQFVTISLAFFDSLIVPANLNSNFQIIIHALLHL